MKFKKNMKKGFTLVELIVVIAIVAILAAVSVVSYLAFINSANESADIQLVKQLNVALQADETLNGPRDTMHEMLGAMEENGFVVENLTKTKSGYDIVWDQENNRFALLNSEGKSIYQEKDLPEAKYSIWKFADTKEEATNANYSVYLTSLFEDDGTLLTVNAGLDVGNYDRLTSISYENTSENISENVQEVVIRTNSAETEMSIDAKLDTIHHYDLIGAVDVIRTADGSYHEFGTAGFVQVASGRVIAENGGVIESVLLKEKASGDELPALIQIKEGGVINNKYATSQAVIEANNTFISAGMTVSTTFDLTTNDNPETGKVVTSESEIEDIKEESVEEIKPARAIEVTQTNYTTIFTVSGNYYLGENIVHVSAPFVIPEGLTVNLDLNGHDISCFYEELDLDYYFSHNSDDSFLASVSTINNKGTLTVSGAGTIGGTGGWFGIYNEGQLILDGPTIRGGSVVFSDTGVTFYANAIDLSEGATADNMGPNISTTIPYVFVASGGSSTPAHIIKPAD